MAATASDLATFGRIIEGLHSEALRCLTTTEDSVMRKAWHRVADGLADALQAVDGRDAQIDADERAAAKAREARVWTRSIREFPPEHGNTPSSVRRCVGCNRMATLGVTSKRCAECWRATQDWTR